MMRAHYFPLALTAIAALSVFTGKPAAATTYTVAAASLPAAIVSASNGDTINVYAGTCSAHVAVNKSLTIRGAQADVPGAAGTRGGSETILANGVTVSANSVELNGLVIRGGDLVNDTTGSGVFVRPTTNSLMFKNNIVENNMFGLYLNGSAQTVEFNLFRNNNVPGSATGDGLYSDAGLQNSTISDNSFTGNPIGSVVIIGGVNGAVADGIHITNNNIVNDGTIAIYGSTNVEIDNNLVSDIANGHGLILGGSDNHIVVHDNLFLRSQYRGIRVSVGPKYNANRDVQLYYNDLIDNQLGGLSVVDGAYKDNSTLMYDMHVDGKVDAECNSWGSTTGPTNPANPSGVGDKVSGDADFLPFKRYVTLTKLVTATLQQTFSNFTTHTFLQTVRITNTGTKTMSGPAYLVFDGFAAKGITLTNASGTQDDECSPPLGSPMFTVLTNGSTLAAKKSLIITLRFTTTPSASFDPSKIGGTDIDVSRRILAGSYR